MGFFNDLGKKASEAYKTTSDKTNRMAREMKLKSYINENKNRINEVYTEIGKKVYESFNEGNFSDIQNLIKPEIDRIEEYAKKIENMNNEIRTINNIKLCKICAAEIDLGARFCPKCGAEQKEDIEETESTDNVIETVVNAEPIYPTEPAVTEPVDETPEVIAEEPVAEEIVVEEPVKEEINQEDQENQEGNNE